MGKWFCFIGKPRIGVRKTSSSALNIKECFILVDFKPWLYGKQPIPHQNPFFSLLPIRHILQLSYEPKIAKKGGSCYQLWTIKQVPFFSGKITIFQPTACLPGYCKVPIWANGWFLWPKWVPRHIRTCPRFNFENKNLGSCSQISASETTVWW